MPYPQFDRSKVVFKPLSERKNKKRIEDDCVKADDDITSPEGKTLLSSDEMRLFADRIQAARVAGRPVMLTFGAHSIKNGLAPVMIDLIEKRWVTHLSTNGAGIIHDWEFAFLGESSEDVKTGVDRGEFGNWQETGFYINLAIAVGAYEGKGYGESVGALIQNERLTIPSESELVDKVCSGITDNPEQSASAADLLQLVRMLNLSPGEMIVPHPYKRFSLQAAAYRMGVPFTGHPMIGHDIIYNHPANHGGAIGRAALRDFLTFAESVSRLHSGVYLSIGSAVMSPMVFEKSLSISQNIAIQEGRKITGHTIIVVDLAPATWDWSQGEPPENNPAYYSRYCKSFSRMGGELHYVCADNRDFLLSLAKTLDK